MQQIFRSLVLVSLGLYILYFFFPYIEPLIYDESRLQIWSSSGYDSLIDFPTWYFYLWLAYWFVVSIGLFYFMHWSRDALIVGYILLVFLSPVHGSSIQSPLSSSISMLNSLVDGAIIALAYFSSVAGQFNEKTD